MQADLLAGGPLWAAIAAFAVIPALCEELLFRGFLLAGLRERLSPGLTVIVVGVVFGVFHIYIEKIPLVSLLGMLLAYVCLRSGSIYPAMLVHAANNALTLAAHREEAVRSFFGLNGSAAGLAINARTMAFVAAFAAGLWLIARGSRVSVIRV